MLITWYFIREDRELSRGQRLGIKLLRLSMVLILILAILRPGAIFTRKSEPRGAIAVMVDVSQSAELPSGVDRKSRWQVETELWNKLVQSQSKLGNESPLVIYGYDDKLRRIQGDSNNQVTIAPNGSFTDVGKTLSELHRSTLLSGWAMRRKRFCLGPSILSRWHGNLPSSIFRS